jgi:hypothetical protein
MTLRRLTVATMLLCALGVWGFARSDEPQAGDPPARTNTRDEAEVRFRTNQSTHWRHVAIGNRCGN